jgi:hypothetical protein
MNHDAPRTSSLVRSRAVKLGLAASAVVASVAVAQAGPVAAQSTQFAIRGIGSTKLDVGKKVINTLAVACVTPHTNTFVHCVPAGSATLKVSAATKSKLKLPSATIAKGPIKAFAVPAGGEGESGGRVKLEASSAVRSKLKAAKTIELTYTLTVTGPIQETIKKKMKWSISFDGASRLSLRSSGDDFALSGGR